MQLQVLGTAAGGGIPQWNCACPGCAGARARPHLRRRHASLAVRAAEGRWYLVNATPDLGDQVEDCPALHPGPAARQTPLAGVVLTDAELDHTLGIARLREADDLQIVATAPVRGALLDQLRLGAVLAPYTTVRWRDLTPDPQPLDAEAESDLEISAVPLSAKRPRYAVGTGPDADTWVVALRLHDRTNHTTAVYAPALGVWPDALQEAVDEADCVIIDGTFWDEDEPIRTGISQRTATGMGHLPIDGPDGTARRLAPLAARCLYTHLNNTNPLVDPEAPQHKQLAEWNLEVAADKTVIEL
ncbi:pyrroloquinoline quinone biosynthesis protein PqqB [Streptomyces sp. 21So2-11]|uniref:pyrroloquinoline quinone biosynthesis protein PqqB n=1 Tax=Streptomyces sp. 21So2-11 TaxID=3144408 RepID=UPI00321BBB53